MDFQYTYLFILAPNPTKYFSTTSFLLYHALNYSVSFLIMFSLLYQVQLNILQQLHFHENMN